MSNPPKPLLDLTAVVMQFGALRAVDVAAMSIAIGERRAVIGPNGAGKTTLFNTITGVLRPTSGRIAFDGHDITRQLPHRRAKLGIARTFQITNLFPTLSVMDNMKLALRGLKPRKFSMFGDGALTAEERSIAEHALGMTRLGERQSAIVRDMSYGEQRQLELAMALSSTPRLLLLDEPAAGLSPAERTIVAEIVRSLPRDITVVLIEHDMDLALGLVDYVTCMYEGRVLVEASPAEIRSNATVQDVYLGKARHHA